MACVVINILVGLNFAVGYNKTKAKVVSFVFGALTLPVIVGSIFALVLIEPDMDMPRFIVGCLLNSGVALAMIFGGVYLAEKAENACTGCNSVKWPLGGHNAGLCWHCSDLLDNKKNTLLAEIANNTESFRKIAHSKYKSSQQEQDLQAQREVLFKELWELEDAK
jgi:hypothetical protein